MRRTALILNKRQWLLQLLFVCCLVFTSTTYLQAQLFKAAYDQNHPPNTYRSSQNPFYWKNHKLPNAYWQQDVHYHIEARYEEEKEQLQGEIILTYWNNSPQTLYDLAFSTGMCPEEREGKKWIEIESIQNLNTGKSLSASNASTGSLKKFDLTTPLQSGNFLRLRIKFKTNFLKDASCVLGITELNDKFALRGAGWFPQITNYTLGDWEKPGLIGSSGFPFGTFSVHLDFPGNYILDASGELQNKSQALPDTLYEAIQMDKNKEELAKEILDGKKAERKIWKFHVENIHNFSFIASPDLRLLKTFVSRSELRVYSFPEDQGIAFKILSQVREDFQKCAQDYGRFPYSKLITAYLQESESFPMLNLVSGTSSDLKFLTKYATFSQWFQTLFSGRDLNSRNLFAGISQFLAVQNLENGTLEHKYLLQPFKTKSNTKYAWKDIDKNSISLLCLSDLIGKETLNKGITKFIKDWRLLQASASDFWPYLYQDNPSLIRSFANDWNQQEASIDYEIDSTSLNKKSDGSYDLVINRKGSIHLPLELIVKNKSNKSQYFYIPVSAKQAYQEGKRLTAWTANDKQYRSNIKINGEIKSIELTGRANALDNAPIDNKLGGKSNTENQTNKNKVEATPSIKKNKLLANRHLRPLLWYNSYDGLKPGIRAKMSDKEGNFIEVKTWLNTRVLSKQSYQSDFPEILKNKQDLFSFQIEGQSSIASIIPETSVQAKIGWIDGLYFGKWGIERKSSETDIMRIYIHSMKRLELSDNEYLINKNQWSTGKWNNMIHLEFIQKPAFLGEEGGIKLGIGSNSLFTDFDYNFANAEIKSNFAFSDWGLRSRFFVQFGSGTSIAPESSLYLSGGNPSQMMDSPVYRSAGIIPDAWGGFGQAVQHAHFGGGLNLRGFSGLALSEIQNGQAVEAYRGTSGLSLNLEFEFQDLVGIKKEQLKRRTGLELSTYSFLDFGILGAPSTTSKLRFFQAKMDWGLGAALKINSFGGFYNFQAFTIRADFPLFISETVQENDQAFAFRWMLAIGRAF